VVLNLQENGHNAEQIALLGEVAKKAFAVSGRN